MDRAGRDGLGLGLAIVERLCHLLKHSVGVASVVGKGSRFYVSVPVAPKRVRFQKAAPQSAPMFDAVVGKLVVVIDDDALVLDLPSGRSLIHRPAALRTCPVDAHGVGGLIRPGGIGCAVSS